MTIGGTPHHGVGPVTVPQCHGTTRRLAKFQSIKMDYTTITACRSCACTKLTYLFTLGDQYVSDFVPKERIFSSPKVPIELVLCEMCGLVQQLHSAPADMLYRRHYWYRSGTTDTMRRALFDVANRATEIVSLSDGDVVLDIGSNDGTLLRAYDYCGKSKLVKVGVEPAENLQTEGKRGIDLLVEGFWPGTPEWLEEFCKGFKPKIVTALGMLYDIEDPNPFIGDVAKVLHPEGVFIAQLMCLKQMLQLGDVGNLCTEHLEFYSLRSLVWLLQRHGLEPFKIEENNVNGGSYRLYCRHQGSGVGTLSAGVYDLSLVKYEALENGMSLTDPTTYSSFFQEAVRNRDECVRWLSTQYALGKHIHVYGSSTKGNVLLQFMKLAGNWLADKVADDVLPIIDCAADKSPEKWGMYTVGSGIPIVSEEESRRMNPDIYLVLPYAFRDEFIEREKHFIARGGKLIFPLPRFEVVGNA